jgi:hypothetical protein
MTLIKILDLSTSGVGCLDANVQHSGGDLRVEYGYETEESTWTGAIRFENVGAFRYANERHAKAFPSEAYDAVVEIPDSDWMKGLLAERPVDLQWPFERRHFAVFLSNCGYLEVIAERVEALPGKERV